VLCREEAYDLCALLAKKRESSNACPNIIGVVKQQADDAEADAKLGVKEFAENYFCGPLYLDEEMKLYEMLGSRKLSLLSVLWNPISSYRSYKAINERIKAKKLDGNLKGEGLVKGAVLVVSPGGEIVYTYLEETGQELPVAEIEAAVDSLITK